MPDQLRIWLRGFCRLLTLMAWPLAALAAPGPVVVLTLNGAVSPATADYVVHGIRKAAEQRASLVVVQIDTPGGLDSSMREIVKEILASPVPVAAFVAPDGARAASAGTFILYASHIAAMAPATNVGAATPVQIGIGPEREPEPKDKSMRDESAKAKGEATTKKNALAAKDTMTHKQIQDASAFIRSLAQLRGRNAQWGEQAVREAVSLSAEEALKLNVIDVVAHDVNDLARQIDGRKVTAQGKEQVLATKGAAIVVLEPDWRNRLLAVIADPNVALILMMIGISGLMFEFMNPGFVLPGVVGGICLFLALYALQLLPINYAGLGLIFLGITLIVAEAFVPSFGVLGIGGVIAFVIGSVILLEPETAAAGYKLMLPLVVIAAMVMVAIVVLIGTMAVRARRRPVVSGIQTMVGAQGVALDDLRTEGWASIHGEIWRVLSSVPLARGQKLRVVRIDGLTLSVEPMTAQPDGGAS